jgi:hypothetical protein
MSASAVIRQRADQSLAAAERIGHRRRQRDRRVGGEPDRRHGQQGEEQRPVAPHVLQRRAHAVVGAVPPLRWRREVHHEQKDREDHVQPGGDREPLGGAEVGGQIGADHRADHPTDRHRNAVERHGRRELTVADQVGHDRLHRRSADHETDTHQQRAGQHGGRGVPVVDRQPHRDGPGPGNAQHPAEQDLSRRVAGVGPLTAGGAQDQLRAELHDPDQADHQRRPRRVVHHDGRHDAVRPHRDDGEHLAPEQRPEDRVEHQAESSPRPKRRGSRHEICIAHVCMSAEVVTIPCPAVDAALWWYSHHVRTSGLIAVGSGPAGLSAAAAFREQHPQLPVQILTADPAMPYAKPPLSKDFLCGRGHAVELHAPDWFARRRLQLVRGITVDHVDLENREVITRGGRRYPYWHLVLAPGARPVPLDVPGAPHARQMPWPSGCPRCRPARRW